MSSSFDVARFEELRVRRGTLLGHPLVARASTASTNDDALRAAGRGEVSGAVFVADEQTRGRGRRGNTWISPAGENLTCTLLLRPSLRHAAIGCVPLVVGLGVRAALAARVAGRVGVKWPNDVLVDDRKIAGILVESHTQGARVDALAVGVGINIATRQFPPEIASVATSLAVLGDTGATREDVLADVLGELQGRLEVLETSGLVPFIDELREHDVLLGRSLRVDRLEGIARGIASSGALLVEDSGGRMHHVTSGTVEWDRTAAPPANAP